MIELLIETFNDSDKATQVIILFTIAFLLLSFFKKF